MDKSMKRTTVLYMVDVLIELAGSERNLYEIVTRLNREYYRPIVVCLRGGRLVSVLRNRGIEVVDLKIRKIYGLQSIRKALMVYKMLKIEKVDILVTYHEGSDMLGCILGKLARVPVLISSRRDMGHGLKKRHTYIYRMINRMYDRILTVSDAVRDVVMQREHTPWHKMITVHNGVDIEKYAKQIDVNKTKASLGIESKRPVVGMLAVVRPIKGYEYFIEAASMVLKNYPEVYFIGVGWHDNGEYYKQLIEQIKRLGVEDSVKLIGGRTEAAEMLAVMDICVFSSKNEGFSNAVVEAMAAGKPVIATNRGGTPEAVSHGKTGILVPTEDSKSLANAIVSLLKDKSKANEMGESGRQRARQLFSMSKMMREIEDLYERSLREKENEIRHIRSINMRAIVRVLKGFVSSIVYYAGVARLYRIFIENNNGVKILAYHRIGMDGIINGMNIAVSNYEKQMRYVRRYYNVIDLYEAVDMLERRLTIPNNSLVVTFDDGYRANYLYAFPILKRYGISATIFLTVGAIERNEMLWFDIVTEAFKYTKKHEFNGEVLGIGKKKINTYNRRLSVADTVMEIMKNIAGDKRKKMLESVVKELGVDIAGIAPKRPMLSWEEINHMKEYGITFGSHGMSHTILTKLTTEELEYEISESKRIIREKTGIDVVLFAYPNGLYTDFNGEIGHMLKKYDYRAAVTLIKGNNTFSESIFSLKRYCITAGMESSVLGRFSKTIFAVEMSGIYQHIKGMVKKEQC